MVLATVDRLPSRYGWRNRIANTRARHSLRKAASLRSNSLSVRDLYRIGLSVLSSCVFSSTHLTCVLQASVPAVYCRFARGRRSIDRIFSSCLGASTESISSSVSVGNVLGSSARNFLFNEATVLEKRGTKQPYMLRSHKEERISFRVVGYCNSCTLCVVTSAISDRPGRVT